MLLNQSSRRVDVMQCNYHLCKQVHNIKGILCILPNACCWNNLEHPVERVSTVLQQTRLTDWRTDEGANEHLTSCEAEQEEVVLDDDATDLTTMRRWESSTAQRRPSERYKKYRVLLHLTYQNLRFLLRIRLYITDISWKCCKTMKKTYIFDVNEFHWTGAVTFFSSKSTYVYHMYLS